MPSENPVPMEMPPLTTTEDGSPRRVGVELEFGRVSLVDAAGAIAALFGGEVVWQDAHRARIETPRYGDFLAELDSDYVHPASPLSADPSLLERAEELAREAIGDVIEWWMPREIVSPPLALDVLPEMDRLCAALREKGAVGTDAGWQYAFALQLNPEVPRQDCASVLGIFRAYLLMSDWLYSVSAGDRLRSLLAFAKPFPRYYVRKVLDPAYAPDWAQFMDDYIHANPDRNQGLDMYPLFAHLDPGRVTSHLGGPQIKPRPAFHYRVPDSRVQDPDWSIVAEWNRWVQVERLAADAAALAERRDLYLGTYAGRPPDEWARDTAAWLTG